MSATGDLALVWNSKAGNADLQLLQNDLESDEGLETAVALSLFTDRRADDTDALPDNSDDRRGWWADQFASVSGDLFGSRLWLLDRSKDLGSVLARAEFYAKEALQWMLDDGVASAVDVVASEPQRGILGLAITITRPDPSKKASFQFNYNWAAQAATGF